MLRKAKDLLGHKLSAVDGEIGRVKDFYFDDLNWTVRYLVADNGNWLSHRQVLISPFSIAELHSKPHKVVEVKLTKKQIEDSPPIETHKPVSRQYEEKYSQYYGWPYYWPGPLLWGNVAYPALYMPQTPPAQPPLPASASEESHLRSTSEVEGYELQALNDHFGKVRDFIVEEKFWAIRYLVIDTRKWLPGKHVLLSPQWIAWVSWREANVYVDLDKDTVKRAPEYHLEQDIDRAYEEKLFRHYSREPYWAEKPELTTTR